MEILRKGRLAYVENVVILENIFHYLFGFCCNNMGAVEAYTYFESDALKQFLGSTWWVYYYIIPLFIAILFAIWTQSPQEGAGETFDPRSRRVMLNHVENFWVKSVLEKSLHGVALLELGIKEDPSAVKYPWTIKKESTNETLTTGKSMLEIFKEIGLGRSLLILGAPGSGKTTMLLELTRQLIERARNDETEPIPVVFNLASWTEKTTLADWLAEQLNTVYYVNKKTGVKWVSENKMLLLLDGLDEVKQENRARCVEAVNHFRNEHGLTSLVVCSRIGEYSAIQTKLSFEGAIALQPLTLAQVNTFFDRFGKSLAAAKGLLKKDEALRELAETPLMLSIMALAYKDKKPEELPPLKNIADQRKHLFDTYIDRMFERPTRIKNETFAKTQTLRYLGWLAHKLIQHNLITYQIEAMQPSWLGDEKQKHVYKWIVSLIFGLSGGLSFGLISGLIFGLSGGLIFGLSGGLSFWWIAESNNHIQILDKLKWSWSSIRENLIGGLIFGLISGLLGGLLGGLIAGLNGGLIGRLNGGLIVGLIVGLISGLMGGLIDGSMGEQLEESTEPGKRLKQSIFYGFLLSILFGLFTGLFSITVFRLTGGWLGGLISGLSATHRLVLGLMLGFVAGIYSGFDSLIRHFVLRYMLIKNNFLPRQLIPFLDYAVDLIFLRRVGGSYIFVHRLLMEHFAEMEA
ncbi:MAG TPA: NACHT domain-containing protein [Anaerolineae bacterium]|nr:NACHT domain-containing protein [Anaerolineae bacterium]HRJ54686.1 NACHT domain-containing protein [Anaerolineales bacterium]